MGEQSYNLCFGTDIHKIRPEALEALQEACEAFVVSAKFSYRHKLPKTAIWQCLMGEGHGRLVSFLWHSRKNVYQGRRICLYVLSVCMFKCVCNRFGVIRKSAANVGQTI